MSTLIILSLLAVAAPLPAVAQEVHTFNVAASDAASALRLFADEAGIQILASADDLKNKKFNAVSGDISTEEALNHLLAGTGLDHRYVGDRAVALVSSSSAAAVPSTATLPNFAPSGDQSPSQIDGISTQTEAKKGLRDRIHVAQKDQEAKPIPVESSSSPNSQKTPEQSLEEIVVTAQKRSEKLLDVPSSISVLSGERLESLQSNSLSDYASYIPGLSIVSGGTPGNTTIVMRGIATNYDGESSAATVATYIDDIPVGTASNLVRGARYGVDLMPYDIEQVEVLRGPQGTLYGADAMSGLIKYTLRKPDLTQFEARVGGDLQNVNGSDGTDWGGHGSVNVPIVDGKLAIRMSGFYQDTAGYIDNVGLGIKNDNHSTESGGRATMLWQATDRFWVQATALLQNIDAAGSTAVTLNSATQRPVYGPESDSTLLPQPFTQKLRSYSLTANGDLGFATLSSASSLWHTDSTQWWDATAYYSPVIPTVIPGYSNALVGFYTDDTASKFTEEVRLTSPADQRLQWILGGFYTDERGVEFLPIYGYTASRAPLPPPAYQLYISTGPAPGSYYRETAAFGDVTYKVTDRFDVTGGLRYAKNSQFYIGDTSIAVPAFGGPTFVSGESEACVTTWMTNVRFHLDQNTMLYARAASGYRPGGANLGEPPGVPLTYKPDSLVSYEVGFKGEFADHRLQFDLAAFHIDWSHIQLLSSYQEFFYTGNGGSAISNGIELTTSYKISEHLQLGATLDHTDAHLTQDAPAIGGMDGDQLPEAPRWSSSVTVDYRRPLDARRIFLFGGGYRYVDKVNNQFLNSPSGGGALPTLPQNIVDLYTGLIVDRLTLRLYAKNAFNDRSYTGLFFVFNPERPLFVPVQPRTVGFNADFAF